MRIVTIEKDKQPSHCLFHPACEGTSVMSIGTFCRLLRDMKLCASGIFRSSNNRLPPDKRSFDGRRTII